MIRSSACRRWHPDAAANTAQGHRSYTTLRGTILLDGTGWLPEPLRLAGSDPAVTEPASEVEELPDFLTGEEEAADPEAAEPRAIAAE